MSGFVPIGTTDGSDYHGKLRQLTLDGASLAFLGDMVIAGTDVAADIVPRVETAPDDQEAGMLGAIVEFVPDFTDEGSLVTNNHPAGTTITDDQSVRVVYGSGVLYAGVVEASVDGTVIGTVRQLDASVAGNAVTGVSGQRIGDAAAGTSGFLIEGLQQIEGNGNAYSLAGVTRLVFELVQ